MVLEDSTASPTDFTSDYSSPTSDSDPYASSPDKVQIAIDVSQLPSSVPIFGPLFGWTTQNLINGIDGHVQRTSALLKRPVTADEATAIAYWTARSYAIASWGDPLGLAVGGWRAYQTRSTFRFPLVAPNAATFNPERVSIFGAELVRGVWARTIWHGLRGGAYGIFGSWVGGLLVTSYALTTRAAGEQTDPRLREVQAKLMEVTREVVAAAARGERKREGRAVGQRGDPTGQGQRSAGELWGNHRRGIGGDDASPTAGNAEGFDYGADSDDGRLARSDGGVLSDQQMRGQEVRQQPSPSQSPTENRASTFKMEKTERQPRSFDDDYDDASSAAGTGSTNAGSGGGSVWEKIRKEAGSTPSNAGRRRRAERATAQQEQQEGSTTEDSFGFSTSEEERQLAKAEAQRAFDEQVERERRGGDFGGRRW